MCWLRMFLVFGGRKHGHSSTHPSSLAQPPAVNSCQTSLRSSHKIMIVDLAAPSLNYKVLEGKVFGKKIRFFPEFLEESDDY